MESNLPIGLIGYVYKDKNNILQIGKTIFLELRTDKKTVNKSIEKMKEIEKTDGFMFWNNSLEGEKFFKDNNKTFTECLTNMILNQK